MMIGVMFIGLPLFMFFAIVLLPKGRPALWGVLIGAALIALIWVSYLFSIGPLFIGVDRADSFSVFLAVLLTGAWALAALLQVIRGGFGANAPRWLWPVLIIGALIVVGGPTVKILGI